MKENPYKDIWNIDYYSTSDEDDNESETSSSEESSSEEQSPQKDETQFSAAGTQSKGLSKGPKKQKKKEDVVDLLLQDDKLLSRRDAEAKLNKIRNKRNLR